MDYTFRRRLTVAVVVALLPPLQMFVTQPVVVASAGAITQLMASSAAVKSFTAERFAVRLGWPFGNGVDHK